MYSEISARIRLNANTVATVIGESDDSISKVPTPVITRGRMRLLPINPTNPAKTAITSPSNRSMYRICLWFIPRVRRRPISLFLIPNTTSVIVKPRYHAVKNTGRLTITVLVFI